MPGAGQVRRTACTCQINSRRCWPCWVLLGAHLWVLHMHALCELQEAAHLLYPQPCHVPAGPGPPLRALWISHKLSKMQEGLCKYFAPVVVCRMFSVLGGSSAVPPAGGRDVADGSGIVPVRPLCSLLWCMHVVIDACA